MTTRALPVALMLVAATAAGAELDLFVTDYGENPTREQRPLIERALTFVGPKKVTIKTPDGKTVTYQSPRKVAVQRQAAGDPREARVFASLGEAEPFSFLLRPKETLQDVFITATALTGPAGTIPRENVVVTSVESRYPGHLPEIEMLADHPANVLFPGHSLQTPAQVRKGLYDVRGRLLFPGGNGLPVAGISTVGKQGIIESR